VRLRDGADTFGTPVGGAIYSFGEDPSGKIYVLLGTGTILRVTALYVPIG